MVFKPPVGQRAGQQTSTVVRQVGILEARYTFDTWRYLDYDNIPDLYQTPPGADPLDPALAVKLNPDFPNLAPVATYCAARNPTAAAAYPVLPLALFGPQDVRLLTGSILGGELPPLVIVPPPHDPPVPPA